MVGARELVSGEAPQLQTLVEQLSLRARVVKPRLYVIPDGFPRALSVGRSPASSSIAVSTGLLGLPSPAELEGVVAHEVAHIRNRDTLVQTTVVVLAGSLVEFSRIGGWLARALLYVLGPVAASFTHLLLSPSVAVLLVVDDLAARQGGLVEVIEELFVPAVELREPRDLIAQQPHVGKPLDFDPERHGGGPRRRRRGRALRQRRGLVCSASAPRARRCGVVVRRADRAGDQHRGHPEYAFTVG